MTQRLLYRGPDDMSALFSGQTFARHPLQEAALAELHARPAPSVEAPATLCRIVLAAAEPATNGSHHLINVLCEQFGAPAPLASARYHVIACEKGELRWEEHTEFTTCTFVFPEGGETPEALPGCLDVLAKAAGESHQMLAGMILTVQRYGTRLPDFHPETCVSAIASEQAFLTTEFKAADRGLVRYQLLNHALPPAECGVFAQRILEIETYRMLALMSLPRARRAGAAVKQIEEELQALTRSIDEEKDTRSAEDLFASLSGLSARTEAEISATTYRFAAAAAYGAIVEDRLASLREQPFAHYPQPGRFLMTRLTPALRTCASMQDALAGLAQRCARASDLIRTRIDLQLARQNNDLLAALDARTRLQMRLQQTVEGLSIAALSYYIAGIALYLFKGAKEAGWMPVDPTIAIAACLPFIVAAVGWVIWNIRRKHSAP